MQMRLAPCFFRRVSRDDTPGLAGRWIRTAPSFFVAAARLLRPSSPGTGRLTTCAVDARRTSDILLRSVTAIDTCMWKFSSACIVVQSRGFGNAARGACGRHLKQPGIARAETSRDLFLRRPVDCQRPLEQRHVLQTSTERVVQPAWPRCGQAPLRNTCCVEEIGPA